MADISAPLICDGKKNKPQVYYGLLTAQNGCPIAISVYEGNTSDTKTLTPQVQKLRWRGISRTSTGDSRCRVISSNGCVGLWA